MPWNLPLSRHLRLGIPGFPHICEGFYHFSARAPSGQRHAQSLRKEPFEAPQQVVGASAARHALKLAPYRATFDLGSSGSHIFAKDFATLRQGPHAVKKCMEPVPEACSSLPLGSSASGKPPHPHTRGKIWGSHPGASGQLPVILYMPKARYRVPTYLNGFRGTHKKQTKSFGNHREPEGTRREPMENVHGNQRNQQGTH